jgi:enamine deaminase RidA (YjgF/YER057c/UK114 family)
MHHTTAPNHPESRRLSSRVEDGFHLVSLPANGGEEVFLSLPARRGEAAADLFQRLYRFAEDHPQYRFVRQDVFGVVCDPATPHSRAYRLNGEEWPVTWVHQGNGSGSPVAGIQVHALAGREVQRLRWQDRVVGVAYEDEWARYCVLTGLRPENPRHTRRRQARTLFDLMERTLALAGMSFTDVFRTWFYLDDILGWYEEFNAARNEFFRRRGVFDRLVPASTGVGGSNGAGTAVMADLLALQPKCAEARCFAVPSPLQCPALDYGSSFSRAVEFCLPGQRRLHVSGTASIRPDGHTAHPGNAAAQVALTMEVVAAILRSRGMSWADTVRGLAYFKHMEDAVELRRWCAAHGLAGWPVIVAKADICRDDLLFELELDAVQLG